MKETRESERWLIGVISLLTSLVGCACFISIVCSHPLLESLTITITVFVVHSLLWFAVVCAVTLYVALHRNIDTLSIREKITDKLDEIIPGWVYPSLCIPASIMISSFLEMDIWFATKVGLILSIVLVLEDMLVPDEIPHQNNK